MSTAVPEAPFQVNSSQAMAVSASRPGYTPAFDTKRFPFLDPRHICGLCFGVVNPNGAKQCCEPHFFCQSCIEQWQEQNSICPVTSCQSPIYFTFENGVKVNTNVPEDSKNILSKLELTCSAVGCPVKLAMHMMPEHEASCPFLKTNVKAFVSSTTRRIKTLESDVTVHKNKARTAERRLAEANAKLAVLTAAHKVNEAKMLKYRKEKNEALKNLDTVENELAEAKVRRRRSAVLGPNFKWKDHVTLVGFSGSFINNSLIKAQGNRYECNYCSEDQLSDKHKPEIRRHMENKHADWFTSVTAFPQFVDGKQMAIDIEDVD